MKKVYPLAAIGLAVAVTRWTRKKLRFRLRARTIIITGGSRGLGFALARELLLRGNRVALLARNREELDQALNKLPERRNILAVPCDVTDKEQVDEAFEQVESHFGAADVLINNAGAIMVGPMDSMTEEDYRKSLEISFWGPFYTTRAILPMMRAQRHGRIVNISSIGGKISVPHLHPYSVGKFALAGFSEGLHVELRKENIIVTTIYPGLMRTGSPRNATFKGKHGKEYAWFSLSDSLPGISMDATRASRQIIAACEFGKARQILSIPAKLAIKANELFPELAASLLSGTNRLLPGEGGIGKDSALGKDSQSSLTPSSLTQLGERAAINNNEVA